MSMTPEAKSKLSTTIRALRTRLLTDLKSSAESTYQFASKIDRAKLTAAQRVRRGRIDEWVDLQVRTQAQRKNARKHEDFRRDLEKQAAYTLLNRMVILRLMESMGLRPQKVATGGWNSSIYKAFREIAPTLVNVKYDENEGLAFLLQMIFEELALDMPGLYGPAGAAELIPIPPATLRTVIEAFDDPELESCWTDDMTLGWIYQYWNDPEREKLDAKINEGGKIEPHEIASKTQMFTERYMVDWLLQNSLGPMWLAMCKKHGWTPECESTGTLEALEQRRAEWRAKRDAGEVELTDLMPLHTEMERRWAYYVPQPIPDDAVEHAPQSVSELKILDPAVGSGHFLVVAFDLLFALYQEEARHRLNGRMIGGQNDSGKSQEQVGRMISGQNDLQDGNDLSFNHSAPESFCLTPPAIILPQNHSANSAEQSGRMIKGQNDLQDGKEEILNHSAPESFCQLPQHPKEIVESILEKNLHGIDLDPRAVQIAAAALWLKAQQACPDAQPQQLNLVASNLGIASLPDDDPALVELRRVVQAETGVPAKLTNEIVEALRGADHLGSLLKIDKAVDDAIKTYEAEVQQRPVTWQPDFFGTPQAVQRKIDFDAEATRKSLVDGLESFLAKHNTGEDLGLRLRGEQLAAGVRFLRLLREGSYDLIVANPPYQGTNKLVASKYFETHYELGKSDLFAAFLLRGIELVRECGVSSMLTMRNWMFTKQYSDLREYLLETLDLRSIGDFDRGAFENIRDEVVSVAVATVANQKPSGVSVAICPTPRNDRTRDFERTARKRAATLCQIGRTAFAPLALKVVPEWPCVYWWSDAVLERFNASEILGNQAAVCEGWSGANNPFVLRSHWEIGFLAEKSTNNWVPYIGGANGVEWFEPLRTCILWKFRGLAMKVSQGYYFRNEDQYFKLGVSFTTIGARFGARLHRFPSVFGSTGRTVIHSDKNTVVCSLNTNYVREAIQDLNPTIHFTVGGVSSLPLIEISDSANIVSHLERAFSFHESSRESSVEFKQPGPSPWRYAQEWAQVAVDRLEGEPLPEYVEQLDPEPPTDHLSFALGVALGRFGPDGEGILDPEDVTLSPQPSPARNVREREHVVLPAGILFLDGTLDADEEGDGLSHPASAMLQANWAKYGAQIKKNRSLRQWLSLDFFKDVHKGMYENRPIHWPLSSAKKTFVAWVNIHRMNDRTLTVLLADHLQPTLTRLDGELADLTEARSSTDRKAAREADDRYTDVKAWRDELAEFIASVNQCAVRGPAPADATKPEREVDAVYAPVLNDGVMINSAALWPLLEPLWKEPKKWWKELVAAKGKKDYDWSHLAMRYWPTRVDKKCQSDPSLGVAHGCFWRYHPERAWAWELRLQDEIEQDFRIKEEYVGRMIKRQNDSQDGGDTDFKNSAAQSLGQSSPIASGKANKNQVSSNLEIILPPNHSANIRTQSDEQNYRDTFIADHPNAAFEAIEKELTRRIRKSDDPISEMRILEPGIWSVLPDRCFALELRTSGTQQTDFRLHAPDSDTSREEFLRTRSSEALGIVRTEILSRCSVRKPLSDLRLIDAGLWANSPAECYDLEVEVIKKQKSPFHLVDPNHESARTTFEQANPEKAAQRKELIETYSPTELPGMDTEPEPKKSRRKKSTDVPK